MFARIAIVLLLTTPLQAVEHASKNRVEFPAVPGGKRLLTDFEKSFLKPAFPMTRELVALEPCPHCKSLFDTIILADAGGVLLAE